MNWLKFNFIRQADIARRMGMSPAHFNNKLKERGGAKFNMFEIEKLNEIKRSIIAALNIN
jgi:AraC-like DNA-binding protein